MQRVSSRQRLVSWDAFDATVHSDEDSGDDTQTCSTSSRSYSLRTEEEEIPLVGRKRERPLFSKKGRKSSTTKTATASPCFALMKRDVSLANLVETPVTIPAQDWEVGLASSEEEVHFSDLNQDVQLHALSFLTAADARDFSVVNRTSRKLVLSPEARFLWRNWLARQWPLLQSMHSLTLVDSSRLPTPGKTCFPDKLNLSGLLAMAAKYQPQCVDKATMVPQTLVSLRRFRPEPKQTIFRTLEKPDGTKALQFLGKVGTGDRCIRSDQPLSRPLYNSAIGDKASLLKKILCRTAPNQVARLPPWRPFVAPFVTASSNGTARSVNLTPRLVSYYEVSILERPTRSDSDDEDSVSTDPIARRHPGASDCVAVGVAPRHFHVHTRMPGWDNISYGYHGDDGGIFHGAGEMERRFGPAFGAGDTVGCGVDYTNGGIFFTLNGRFLGYGWSHLNIEYLQQDLYPTVGVDTNWPVQCNYGEHPFQFNLSGMVNGQEGMVRECTAAARYPGKAYRRNHSL